MKVVMLLKYDIVDKEEVHAKLDQIKQKPKEWVQAYHDKMEKFFTRGKMEDVEQRQQFLPRLHLEIRKLCVMRDYANMDELLAIALEVEWVLVKLGEIPFELVVDVVVEKHVNALNESLISFFKQGASSSHGIGSPITNISSVCQIYNAIDHIFIVCPRIKNIKPKCSKCGLPHRTKTMDLDVGTTYVWDILKIDVRRRAKRPNHT
jgi:hypothetical protein